MYIQPRLSNSQPETTEYTFRARSPNARVSATKAKMKPPETKKMKGSVCSLKRRFLDVFSSDSTGVAPEFIFDWG